MTWLCVDNSLRRSPEQLGVEEIKRVHGETAMTKIDILGEMIDKSVTDELAKTHYVM